MGNGKDKAWKCAEVRKTLIFMEDKPMDSERNNKSTGVVHGGIGFTGLLTIVFIVLKLCGVINWSWLWVLSPLWIEFALAILILIPVFIWLVVKAKSGRL